MNIGGVTQAGLRTGGTEAYERLLNPMATDRAAQDAAEVNPSGVRKKETQAAGECETCKNRRYQDGSNDPGVSFKAPTKLSPQQAASAVVSHEREHYSREAGKAEEEGREVVSNDIRIFTGVCPECGQTYVSGGETRTVTRAKQENASFAKEFFDKNLGPYQTGKKIDKKV